jgi:hypothetical protein
MSGRPVTMLVFGGEVKVKTERRSLSFTEFNQLN